jgi:hypothetical protein
VSGFRVFINRKPGLRLESAIFSFSVQFVYTFCKLRGRYAANVIIVYISFSYRRWRAASNLAQGQQPRGYPGKAPGKPLCTRAQGSILESPNVHLQAGLLPNQVARCPMG